LKEREIILKEAIERLIENGIEGDYWDFKEQWHGNKADLLHDIICMANNTTTTCNDGYIIIGINDNGILQGVSVADKNRKNQQQLIDFLKDKKFASGIRPTVCVKTFTINDKAIDVIIINNTNQTPYFLSEDYKGVFKANIYTRVGDTNTPKIMTADIDKVEFLFKKRFGLNLSPLSRVRFLLRDLKSLKDWLPMGTDGVHSNNEYLGVYYNEQNPEFTIELKMNENAFDNGKIEKLDQNFYWINKLPIPLHDAYYYKLKVKYFSAVLYQTPVIFADSFRFKRIMWKKEYFSCNNTVIPYCYIEKDSIDFLLDDFLENSQETIKNTKEYEFHSSLNIEKVNWEYGVNNNPYSVVPVFESADEHTKFREYMKGNLAKFFRQIGTYDSENRPEKETECIACSESYIDYLCKVGKDIKSELKNWRK
jgi:hypothetical protein